MQKSLVRFSLLPIVVGIAAIGNTPVWAAGAASTASATGNAGIEEVVVTARKIEESQQSLPISVAAFSPKDIENKVVLSVRDLGQVVTGMVATTNSQGGAPTFAVRATKTDNGVDGGVAVYFDDMPLVSTVGLLNSFYDIASVEILKGPQGTQFGTNTTGGTITVRAAKPTDKFEGFAEVGVSNFNGSEFTGMINVPVNDVLQLRLAGNTAKRDGFIRNLGVGATTKEFSTDDHESLRFSARIKTADITNDLVADYYNEDDMPRQAIPLLLTTANGGVGNVALRGGKVGTYNTVYIGTDPSGPANTRKYWNRHKNYGIQDVLNWQINDNVSIKNVLGYRDDTDDASENNGGTSFAVINVWTKNTNKSMVDDFTLRINSDDKRLRTNMGLYLSSSERTQLVSANAAQNILLDFTGLPLASNIHNDTLKKLRSRAIYANLDYDLTKELTATLGVRYNKDSGELRYGSANGTGLPDLSTNPRPTAAIRCNATAMVAFPGYDAANCYGYRSADWQAPSYTFVLTDKFAERSLIYAKFSGGYLAGGFNTGIREMGSFKPEKTTEFEAGIKSDWELWNRPIRTNFDVFYGMSKDQQKVQNTNYDDGGSAIGVFNAGATNYYGLDFETKYVPVENLELNLSWTHLEAQYVSFQFPALGGPVRTLTPGRDLSGLHPAQTPKDTVNFGLTYTWPLASSSGKLSTTFTTSYTSEVNYHDIANYGTFGPTWDMSKAYSVSNFSTAWKGIMGSNFDATFWVRNLFDKHYVVYTGAQQTVFGYATAQYGDPRTMGLRVRYNF